MEINIYDEIEFLYDDVSKRFIELIQNKPNAILGLATGSSPIGVYQRLIDAYNNGIISFKEVSTYNLDEYCGLCKDDEQSYNYFMHKELFDHIDINENNIHLPNGEIDPQISCTNYQDLLDQVDIDLQILGIGSNGHIAFNEPNTSFDSHVHQVDLDSKTINDNARFFDGDVSKVPTQAITMGLSDIIKADNIVLIAIGASKQEAVKKLVLELPDPSCPASILQNHPKVTLYLDKEAAKLLMK